MPKPTTTTLARSFMNTTITISVVNPGHHKTTEIGFAIDLGFGEFDRIVKQFTRFNQDSELSNLNRNAGKWTTVSVELYMLVEKMLQLSQATDGAFDPTIIDFLETYGYDPNYDFSKLDKPDLDLLVAKIAANRHSWRGIELKEGNQIKLLPGQRLDLGGIGKGYAIDCAYDKLNKFDSFLIDAGGDMRVKGTNEQEQPWKLGLKHKDVEGREIIFGMLPATNIALACSGSWARKVKQFHHILDPRTGKPIENLATVFVTAETATIADSWATALFVGGRELLEKIPAGMEVLIIDKDSKATATGKFATILSPAE